MIRRVLTTSVAALCLAVAAPTVAEAQVLHLGAGLLLPIGDYGDATKAGFLGNAAVHFNVGENGLWAGIEGNYGQNSFDSDIGKVRLLVLSAILGYSIPTESSIMPYVYGGAGLVNAKADFDDLDDDPDSESELGLQAGVGVTFGGSSLHPFVELELVTAGSDTQWLAANAGVGIPLGN